MGYRTIKIDWLPSSRKQWKTFTAARMEAGRLWSWLVERHVNVRQQGGIWPTKAELQHEIKRQFPHLHSPSAQQTVADFCEAIASAESLRTRGEEYTYPHKKPKYRQVIFTNQEARLRNGMLVLPCGAAGRLSLRLPQGITLPGRLMEVRLDYGSVEIVCEIVDQTRDGGPTIGIDLGVNTVIAATDSEKALLVSCSVPHALQWRHPSKYPATAVAGSPSDTGQVAREGLRPAPTQSRQSFREATGL